MIKEGSAASTAIAEESPNVTLYRNPNRGLCLNYVAYPRNAEDYLGSHAMVIGCYAVEDRVSIGTTKPDVFGHFNPGTSPATPGITGMKTSRTTVLEKQSGTAPPKRLATE